MKYEREIRSALKQLGVNKTYAGYQYILYGMSLIMEDPTCLNFITKALYIDIATQFHTNWECVERNIRTVIDVIWRTDNQELLKVICGNETKKKPTNKEFFLMLYDYITFLVDYEIAISKMDETEVQCYGICPKDGTLCHINLWLCEKLLDQEKKHRDFL